MATNGFDYKEFEKWAKQFGIATKETHEWLKLFLLNEAQEVVARAKLITPIDTGALRNSFAIGDQNIVLMDDPTGRMGIRSTDRPAQVIDEEASTEFTMGGVSEDIQVTIYNPMEYASYVEYGHDQEVGRFVPTIGKRLKNPHVDGVYMLHTAANEVQQGMGQRLEKQYENYLRRRGVL